MTRMAIAVLLVHSPRLRGFRQLDHLNPSSRLDVNNHQRRNMSDASRPTNTLSTKIEQLESEIARLEESVGYVV